MVALAGEYRSGPFRPVPESVRRVIYTQLAMLVVPAGAAVWLFGLEAVRLLVWAAGAAALAELVVNAVRCDHPVGSMAHSVMLGVLVAFTLPAHASGTAAVAGGAAAVVLGKHLFGGLGHYVWQPALVGRLVVQLFFDDRLGMGQSVAALRHFERLTLETGMSVTQYLWRELPDLSDCLTGYIPGGIGETCKITLVAVACYGLYRGYVSWPLPVTFVGAAYAAALLCPVPAGTTGRLVWPGLTAEGVLTGFTYLNYQILSGSILAGAVLFAPDMTSRPITVRGQVIFAAAGGALSMVFRLYTDLAIPCYAAILVCNSFTGMIDRHTRFRRAVFRDHPAGGGHSSLPGGHDASSPPDRSR